MKHWFNGVPLASLGADIGGLAYWFNGVPVPELLPEGETVPLEFLRPDGDATLDGWTDQGGGTSNIMASIDEVSASDTDFVQSPSLVGTTADLTVRLFDGSTEIAEWVHSNIGPAFVDVEQTLTAPQYAAITSFANLFVEFDDDAGAVYRFALGNPPGLVLEPVKVRYRIKKIVE